ncbi:S-adenosyl-L-methionine-dependent methyltransferase [Pseudomassariella vexata]|uniref:S-adenosyl-L-methionine-dependent methyltransferase n=1 Tax=Pseudomassariella vexata TaxID=1141098 RepID=A0A1Y2EHH4_9PEZI|nr:S-adenosyl-L-methionine-dependent methyltransferase [Pseudomassariella vexata]ORY71021.1 S-adenosyl-L-methionine-dependent methyltransferase [Pseudomassariella vexata]
MTAPNSQVDSQVAGFGPAVPAEELDVREDAQSVASSKSSSTFSWGGGSTPSLPRIDEDVSSNTATSIDSTSWRSSTESIRSSIYNFVEENGRTYHRYKAGKYPLPNDVMEQERLDLQHYLFLLTTNNKLQLAHLPPNSRRALDIATGTGIWAIDFASKYPECEVIGTDLSPIQPAYVPSNCRFEIDDAEDEWTFTEPFDFIHGRALLSCFRDPEHVIQQGFMHLKPGGIMEFQDGIFPMGYIGDMPVDSALYKWNELVMEAAALTSRPWTNVQHYKRWFEEAGFEDVNERRFYWPTNPWAKGKYFKTLATYFHLDLMNGLEGISLKLFGHLGWEVERTRAFLEDVKRDFADPRINGYMTVTFVSGRKPLAANLMIIA